MPHFAKLSENNIVLSVEYLTPDQVQDENGIEQESIGIQHQINVHGWPYWKQTSYNTHKGKYYDSETNGIAADQSKSFRKNYAGIGYTYDTTMDAFIILKPDQNPSWILNKDTCSYEAPVSQPSWDTSTEQGEWVESNLRWEKRLKSTPLDEANPFYWNTDTSLYWNTDTNSWDDIS
jgi:hypothetical protein|tara:strand:- start:4729 stop:5259 length:531 start_codon:yes stop_codon:yes gene_type:complete